MSIVPDRLATDARAALAALQADTNVRVRSLQLYHKEVFGQFRKQLQALFLANSVTPRPTEDVDGTAIPARPPFWNSSRQAAAEAADSFDDVSDALYDEDVNLMEDGLDEAMVDGHTRELWLLTEGGLDGARYAPSLPNRARRVTLLLIAGVLALNWQQRRATWRDTSRQQVRQWLNASVTGGLTLDETLQGYDRLTTQLSQRVGQLYDDERVRAYGTGADIALQAARRDGEIAEVWVTRQDKLVCPICEALHGTVTPLQPITDSHPACRCVKVPVPANLRDNPVEFTDFLQSLGIQ